MATAEYKNDFIESYVQVGIEQGIEQGIEKGAVADAAEKLLKLLDGRSLNPTDTQRAQVAGCTDLPQLNRWFDRAITAKTTADVFQE